MTEPSEVQSPSSHGGILFPLDMFRPTMLASIVQEAFVSRARNVLDARLELTRHAQSQLVMMRLHGSIVEDPATFWRENADLAMILSQVMPRQVFLYYASAEPKREGFLVAQQGQTLAGDDADESILPPGTPDDQWPVARLAAQLRCTMAELASGFEGGPRIEMSVMEPTGDDREFLMTLASGLPGTEEDADDGLDEAEQHAQVSAADSMPVGSGSSMSGSAGASGPGGGAGANSGAGAGTPDAPRRRTPAELQAEAEADRKRRAAEKEAELDARKDLIKRARDGLEYTQDELGLVAAVPAELSDADVLAPFVVRKVDGELPAGVPRELSAELQGKRLDIAVKVDFLSEVLLDGKPLDKPRFDAQSETIKLDGLEFQALAVLAPRLGGGTLYRRGKAGVFVSREPGLTIPEQLVVAQSGIAD